MTKALIIGAGAREHAMAWKLKSSPKLSQLWSWPNHPTINQLAPCPLPDTASFTDIANFCRNEGVDVVAVGPETPLSQGFADTLQEHGVACFGPLQAAAELESSKEFAKQIMLKADIPTASAQIASSETECRELSSPFINAGVPVVLKASGLAGGKGVFVCQTSDELENALTRLYQNMASAAQKVLVEEFLIGRECSYFGFIGQNDYTPLGFAVDFKRLGEKDTGPNTGGMGCYTPVPWLPADAQKQVEQRVIEPLLKTLANESISYTGWLYVGLMWHPSKGPQVVEFNCRLGDPEAQILAAADPRDWLEMILYHVGKTTEKPQSQAEMQPSVGVVMTSKDYPYKETDPGASGHIALEEFDNTQTHHKLFGAAVKAGDHNSVTTGRGRVLTCVGQGEKLEFAREQAYLRVKALHAQWPQANFRQDIAAHCYEKLV